MATTEQMSPEELIAVRLLEQAVEQMHISGYEWDGTPVMDDPAFVEALDWTQAWLKRVVSDPTFSTWNADDPSRRIQDEPSGLSKPESWLMQSVRPATLMLAHGLCLYRSGTVNGRQLADSIAIYHREVAGGYSALVTGLRDSMEDAGIKA